jgi:chromosome segregation ATPase
MKLNCIYCKIDFICENQKINTVHQIVKCGHCQKEWLYESQLTGLEKRIKELDDELESNENRLNEEKRFNLEQIDKLEIELNNKNIELEQQKLIEDKLILYEQRLTRSEKKNSEQAILEDKIFKLREKITEQNSIVSIKSEEIEKKTNYLTMKSKSENKETPKIKKMIEQISTAENYNKDSDPKLKKYKFWKV